MRKLGSLALVSIGLAAAPWTAGQAQQLPFGTYMTECEGIHVVDGTLIAMCPRQDRSMRQSALPGAMDCGADIENQDGHLVCTRGQQQNQRANSGTRDGYGTFGNICKQGQGSEFLMIRWAGRTDDVRKFVFDGRTRIHLFLPRGTTIAADCGSFAKPDRPFKFKDLDGG